MNKVSIKIQSPQLCVDVIMPEGKALTYLKRIKKSGLKNMKIVTQKIEKDENKRK